jgi:hypothetical protein
MGVYLQLFQPFCQRDEWIVAVGVCLTIDYQKNGKRALTAFFIEEKMKNGSWCWCMPMGSREYQYRCPGPGSPGKSPAQKASEELKEELHHEIEPGLLGTAEHFCRVDVNSEYRKNRTHHMAFFVSRKPNEGNCGGYSRSEFLTRRAADWHKGHSYRETRAMAHVPVENLLAVPVDNRDVYCQDVDGNWLQLRAVLKKLLRNEDFRKALQLALEYYDRCVLRRP